MSKELDYLDKILNCQPLTVVQRTIIESIKEKIQRLEAIDNAEPSEALKGLKHIRNYYVPEPCSTTTYDYLEIIEQALLKAQEQEIGLEILKPLCEVVETPVKKIRYLKINGVVAYTFKKKAEFDLFKEWLDNE